MSERRIEIKLTSCILVLYERELWKLPADILEKAIRRGKAYKRAMAAQERRLKTQPVKGFDIDNKNTGGLF